jgi:KaiC/GvpD/RAD55 family RecA-like ATPase
MNPSRLSTGLESLDARLGGGLLPGTLTVVVGATGIGKTQLGLHFADAGQRAERKRGIIFDLSARFDSQSHAPYADRLFGWTPENHPAGRFEPDGYFSADRRTGEYLHVFETSGQRVTQQDMGFDAWHDWQARMAATLETAIDFFYGNFVRGCRRAVIDGIEPATRPSESIQHEFFEYVYHQVLRKEPEWLARDLFRQHYRANAHEIERHAYDHRAVTAMLLVTSHESSLDDLIARPLVDGDVLATANTLIFMGKRREAGGMSRGLFVAKHRGSACSDEIIPYRIDDKGLRVE